MNVAIVSSPHGQHIPGAHVADVNHLASKPGRSDNKGGELLSSTSVIVKSVRQDHSLQHQAKITGKSDLPQTKA
jgi:hypothetical protein